MGRERTWQDRMLRNMLAEWLAVRMLDNACLVMHDSCLTLGSQEYVMGQSMKSSSLSYV